MKPTWALGNKEYPASVIEEVVDAGRNFLSFFSIPFKVLISTIIGSKDSQNLLSLHIRDLYTFSFHYF